MMNDDMALVRDYAASQSEPAFATLVVRHIALVHTAALRQVEDAHLAQDVTQAVFIILARKAGSLGPDTILSAWLYRTTCHVAAETRRTRRRRTQREQEAYMQSTLNDPQAGAWEHLSPLLDKAMADLSERDRNALVLRFFENKTAPEIAVALKVNEEAAQKRVARAVEKLRKLFSKRGVTLTTAVIAGAVAANSVQAAPAGLAKAVTAIAVTKGVAVSGSTLTLIKATLKMMAWTKAKTTVAIAAASLFVVCTTTVIVEKLIQPARGRIAETLKPGTFVTAPGVYQWTNASAIGELALQNNKLRPVTLGTSQQPAAGAVIVDHWTNAASESKLTIRSNMVQLVTTSDGPHLTSLGINTWHLGQNWFIYRANGMRVWAYDGNRGLWMLTSTPLSGESSPIESLQEQPPAAVLRRLPDAVRKMLPPSQEPEHAAAF
ncbi:MAG: hypothetical protein JWR26_219 [Pedosphaera sp.]|nr:hypothetical protein [Pedosphaera sp.]